ncbi:NmrA/HSCARG family protein [Sphingomonas sp.]|uniref:NmrA/HSCARG family protein n=1 Tax=Sphingomonas sp. TaxID=28214 RepID=UPI003B3BC754
MSGDTPPILVFGATGHQGGSVADALLKAGASVRALVRDPASAKATALAERGVELVRGDMADPASLRPAMIGARGVFSVQTSSPGGEITDADEVRYGVSIADLAVEAGVRHLVYSSTCSISGAEGAPTGMGHFDSKRAIENHVRTLPLTWTIVRPVTFMDMLTMPGFGLNEGRFSFFPCPDQAMQFIAVEDIGKFVAPIFADADRFGGQTLEIAGDALTGAQIGEAFSRAAGRPIAYSRFPDALLASNPFLGGLAALLDAGPLAGHANLDALRAINPEMQSFDTWLAGSGRDAFERALGVSGTWQYDRGA